MHGSPHETGQQPHRTESYSVQTLLPEQTAQQMGICLPVADQASCSAFCWPAACRDDGRRRRRPARRPPPPLPLPLPLPLPPRATPAAATAAAAAAAAARPTTVANQRRGCLAPHRQ